MNLTGRIKTGFRKSLGAIVAILSAIAFMFVVIYSVGWSSNRSAIGFELSKASIVPNSEISDMISPLLAGKTASSLELDSIEARLKQHPYIKDCDIFYDGSSKLIINPLVRQPIAALATAGKVYYIDKDGFVLPKSMVRPIENLIFVTNLSLDNPSLIKKSARIITTLRENFPDLEGNISEVRYSSSLRGFELLLTTGEMRVVLGGTKNLSRKLTKLRLIIDKKLPREVNDAKYYADLRFAERIIVGKN